MYRLFIVFLCVHISWLSASSQEDLSAPMPVDSAVRMGVLENGMTYYVRHNEEPKDRASFYMIQNVGAILENDDQNGLAHFLEHMAFNGTKHFPGKGIISTLERHGVAFGRNINAYTSQNETVYNMSNVPVSAPGLLDTCLLVLNDWSNYLLLTDEEIDAERGVITEEWRTRRTANFRMHLKYIPALFNDCKYAKRDVIGSLDVIKNHDYKTLRDFYHDWYRTDLQAIAVVGDFDVAEMEQKIKDLFSKIPANDNPYERYSIDIPFHKETKYTLATDKEATQSKVAIYVKEPGTPKNEKGHGYYRQTLVTRLYGKMINNRISELLQKSNPPFINASVGKGELTRETDVFFINATAKTNEEGLALKGVLNEVMRAKRFGFTDGELKRAKADITTSYKNHLQRKDKISHDSYCREFRDYYLKGEPMPGIEYEYHFVTDILPEISLDDVSNFAAQTFKKDNRVIVVSGPEKEDVVHLTEEQAKSIVNTIENDETLQAYVDEVTASSLINEDLQPQKIIQESRIKELNAIEWTLANGCKVVYRYANYNKENVTLLGYSPGGSSLCGNEDVPSVKMMPAIMNTYGVGEFDAIALKKMLSGKTAAIQPTLSSTNEGFAGACRKPDFETMMQLLYLQFNNPRFDEQAFNAMLTRFKAYIANQGSNPSKIMQDSIVFITTDYHPRTRTMDEKFLNEVSFTKMREIYLDRFQNIADFKFFIVGDVSEEVARTMAAKYIGNLKATNRTETWKDHNVSMPEGITNKKIALKMTDAKTTVVIKYENDLEYKAFNRIGMDVIENILRLRYTESIREKEGGTYGVSVSASTSHHPKACGNVSIKFDTDPARTDNLLPLVYLEIDNLMKKGPSEKDLSKVKKNMLKKRAEVKEQNQFWVNAVYDYYIHGENTASIENYEELVKNLSVKDIKKLAKNYFKAADKVELIFMPQE